MFIAHLPAGYLWTQYAVRKRNLAAVGSPEYRMLMAVGLIGSILPDIDLLYFYFIDGRQHLHHGYWTHTPFFWMLLAFAAVILGKALRKPWVVPTAFVLFSSVFLHLLLDTVTGKIAWLAPFSSYDLVLFEVPARYSWWIWNFVFHWTFLIEIAIVLAALAVLARSSGMVRLLPGRAFNGTVQCAGSRASCVKEE